MDINGSVALVTGANRGLGEAIAQHLLERGARKVYAAARRPETVRIAGVEPVALDITDPAQIQQVAAHCQDVTLLVNNAGTNTWQPLVDGDLDQIRLEVETHLFGTLGMIRAFAPVLARNGGGAVLDVLSAMSWFAYPGDGAYHVAKAAAWALTNSVRLELAAQQTLVVGLHLGLADTDMSAAIDGEKAAPAAVAAAALDGIEAGEWEVLVDAWSRGVKSSLADDPRRFYDAMLGVA
jgi:NAD(P)-dependent dehydrogenase (short-subunit alcohol dehydrogenase family)